jgi:hypothetical protein
MCVIWIFSPGQTLYLLLSVCLVGVPRFMNSQPLMRPGLTVPNSCSISCASLIQFILFIQKLFVNGKHPLTLLFIEAV